MSFITHLSKLLLIVGGVNWGLVGLLHFDPIAVFLGEKSFSCCTAYILFGLAAGWLLLAMLYEAVLGPYESGKIAH